MSSFVVDTNVAVVANGASEHVDDPECVLACLSSLKQITRQGVLLLDDLGLILKEYRDSRYLSMRGQPGAGDFFVKWAHENQANGKLCRLVRITPKAEDSQDFQEFPDALSLAKFDRSDRKFVAVALAFGDNPSILNATDTDWWVHKGALEGYGIQIEFLCPREMQPDDEPAADSRRRPRRSGKKG